MTSPNPAGDASESPACRGDTRATVARMRLRAAEEQARAARAGALARGHESRMLAGPEALRELRARMAALQRGAQERHQASAAVHELYAFRLELWLAGQPERAQRPTFMSSLAETIGVSGAAATVYGKRQLTALVAASDATAQAAHELEAALGEGPAAAVAAGGAPVQAAGSALCERWPLYGPAVAELGVRSVAAVALQAPASRLGALCVYSTTAVISDEGALAVSRFADLLAHALLAAPQDQWLLHEGGGQPEFHQAAGMAAARHGCGIDDAQALLRARAFADAQPADVVAWQVLRGETCLW